MDNPALMEENGSNDISPPKAQGFLANRWVRRGAYTLGSLLALWVLAWLAVPPLAKWQGEKIASEQLGRRVSIGAIDFKPWTLELTLRDVALASADGKTQQLTVKRLYADGELESLWRLAPVVDAIQIEEPVLHVTHQGDGRYDFDDILSRLAAKPKKEDDGKPARFALYNLDLKGGSVDFDDQAVGHKHEVRDLQLALPFISNLPSQREIKVLPHLAFVANGSRFDSTAQTLPFTDSRKTDAVMRLAKLDLAPYLGYIPAGLPVSLRLKAAVVDADLSLGFEQTPQPSLRLGGSFEVSGLKTVDGQGADALSFDTLKVELADVRPLEQRVHLASVELNGPNLAVHRDKQGRINLLVATNEEAGSKAIAKAEVPASAAAPNDKPAAGWQVSIDKLAVHGGKAGFTDEMPVEGNGPTAKFQLDQFELAVDSIGYPFTKPLSFKGSAALVGAEGLTPLLSSPVPAPPATGRRQSKPPVTQVVRGAPALAFEGTATDKVAEVSASIDRVPLALAAPYLAQAIHPRLTGNLDAKVALQWAAPKTPELPAEIKLKAERVALSDLMLTDTSAAGQAVKNTNAESRRQSRATSRRGALASVRQIEVVDAQVDLSARVANLGKLTISEPNADVERDSAKRWMYESWLRKPVEAAPAPTPDAKPQGGSQADAPWKFAIDEFALSGGTIGWRDAATARTVRAELSRLKLEVRQLNLDSGKPMPVALSAALGAGRAEPGLISWRGTVGLAPLTAKGDVEAQRLPVHAFEPYFDDAVNIDILRADASFKGQVAFSDSPQGPRLKLSGDAQLEELRTHSRPISTAGTGVAQQGEAEPSIRSVGASAVAAAAQPSSSTRAETRPQVGGVSASQALVAPSAPGAGTASAGGRGLGEELLSWKLLKLAGLDVALEPGQPPRVEVKNTLLSDFYARLIIDPSGRINLQDLLKSGKNDAATSASTPLATVSAGSGANGMPAAGESSAGAGGAVAASAPASAPVASDPNAPVILFGPVQLVNGKVLFSDRFVRPNYSADLTELNGSLSAFSSIAPAGAPQMADLKIVGRAEGSAALEVTGKLNPLAKPLALDIKGKVTDLELPPLTPYSVKYAGHGIERGKLSVDVSYAVQPDGRLTATNRLVLNQLQFGEPVAGAPASLPVKLATALLADSNGVIDLDLPISGSLNDPQFSLGPIIFKAVINLIGRAITAPFTLLARALGGGAGGDDLAQVPFAPGSAALSTDTRERLDKIAKALNDRPALKLTVVGTANLPVEADAWRRERLKALVAAEKRSEGSAGVAGVAGVASRPVEASSLPSAASAPLPAASAAQGTATSVASALGEADYPALLRRVYRRADLPNKPRNAVGLTKDVPVAEMEALLLAHIDVGEDAMRQLAVQRGVAVKDYLASKKLPTERLFLGAARTGGTAPEGAAAPASAAGGSGEVAKWSPHAELNLSAK